jgi:hypothetical protein
MQELELARHGLKVHLRDPSSYTPLRPDLASPGGPVSLTLGNSAEENRRQIGQFSARDAEQYEKYEAWLGRVVEGVDALLDHAALDVDALAGASLVRKVQILRENWHLLGSARALGPVAASFYELMTAPTTKVKRCLESPYIQILRSWTNGSTRSP